MPADDFFRFKPFDAPGAGIPAGDEAVGVKHVNGEIDDPFHQQAESALAFEQAAPRNTFSFHAYLA